MLDSRELKKFDKVYSETYDTVQKYIVCNCSNIEDVKDIVQNVYIDVAKNIKSIKPAYKKYVMGIAKNKLNDYYRYNYKQKIRQVFLKDDDYDLVENVPDNINIEESIVAKYDTESVWKYLTKKNVVIAKIFYLYYYCDMTIKEIGKILEISESNVKNYLYRTLKELNEYFKKEMVENEKRFND